MASFLDVLTEIGAAPSGDMSNVFPPAPSPQNQFPPAPRMGGLGGLGGWVASPNGSDLLTSLGMSLMTSPRNNWLQNMPAAYLGVRKDSRERQQADQERAAMERALVAAGFSPDEARSYSANPQAAKLRLEQVRQQAARASDTQFYDALSGLGGGTGITGSPFAGEAATSRQQPARIPSALLDNNPGGMGQITSDPSASRQPPESSRAITVADSSSGRLNGLLQLRQAYMQAATRARTDDQFQRAKLYLDTLNRQIDEEELRSRPTEAQRDLDLINQQREQQGLPAYRLDEWQQAKARSGATNIDMKGETKYDETLGTEMAKRAIGIQDEATAAQKSLGTLKVMETAMQDPGFYSGTGAGAVTNLKRMANNLGLPGADGIDSIESFNAMSKQAALDAMGGSLGSGFSNADRSFVEEQVANLGNSPEGNQALIGIQRSMANRKLEIARLARAYAEKNDGRLDNGFYDRLARWAEANPMFASGQKTDRAGGGRNSSGPERVNRPPPSRGSTSKGLQWSVER